MAKGTTLKPFQEEDDTVNQIDIKRIWTRALAEGLRAIAEPEVYLRDDLTDTALYHFWDEAVARICVLAHGSDSEWDGRTRKEKECMVEEECPEKSFKEYMRIVLEALGAILNSVTPKSKRGNA